MRTTNHICCRVCIILTIWSQTARALCVYLKLFKWLPLILSFDVCSTTSARRISWLNCQNLNLGKDDLQEIFNLHFTVPEFGTDTNKSQLLDPLQIIDCTFPCASAVWHNVIGASIVLICNEQLIMGFDIFLIVPMIVLNFTTRLYKCSVQSAALHL